MSLATKLRLLQSTTIVLGIKYQMDITSLFVDLLKKHNVTSVGGPRRQQTDEFLKEAERIVRDLGGFSLFTML